jgi:hypothetical protein
MHTYQILAVMIFFSMRGRKRGKEERKEMMRRRGEEGGERDREGGEKLELRGR